MSTRSLTVTSQKFAELYRALEEAEQAIEDLDDRGAFALEEPHPAEEPRIVDTEEISRASVELETALDIVADELTALLEPDSEDSLSLNELLAPYAEAGLVRREVTDTASRLTEWLGAATLTDESGLSIDADLDYDFLIGIIDALRTLTKHLESEHKGVAFSGLA